MKKIKASKHNNACVKFEQIKEVKKNLKKEPTPIPKNQIIKVMPRDSTSGNPAAVHYSGGVIYTDQKHHKFRCLRVRSDAYTEKCTIWGTQRTKMEAWEASIAAIDDYEAKKAKKAR